MADITVGKALDKLNLSAVEEIGGVTSDLFNIANALQVLPQLIKVALSNIQQQKKEIMEKEQAKYTTFVARSAIALKASGTKLTGHDKNLDDLSLSLQTLDDKFNRIKGMRMMFRILFKALIPISLRLMPERGKKNPGKVLVAGDCIKKPKLMLLLKKASLMQLIGWAFHIKVIEFSDTVLNIMIQMFRGNSLFAHMPQSICQLTASLHMKKSNSGRRLN
ncbi:hypothetical protein OROMI_020671 [Orobanche minor]